MVFYKVLLRYVPMITFPIAFVAGIIGYNLERTVRNVETPSIPSVLEKKLQRKKEGETNSYEETPVLERNLSPQMKKNQ